MHYGSVETSDQIRKTLQILKSSPRVGVTTAEINFFTGSMAPGTDVSAVRHNGYRIRCVNEGKNKNGKKVFRYFYEGKQA